MSEQPRVDTEAIKARLAASVRGTWTYDSHTGAIREGNRWCPVANWVQEKADAEFIAHAPTDIAALLAEVEALDKLVAADAKVRAAASALLAILQEPVWGRNNWGIRKTDAMAALDAALNG